MDAAVTMETCPDSETLAAFSDGALDPKVRLEVMRHVADCGQCQHELVELAAAKRELQLEPANVRRGSFGRRWLGPLVAAAAVVVVVFGVPSIRERILGGDPMEQLVQAANQAPERSADARLSGDFAYRGHRSNRGGGDEVVPIDAESAKWAIDLAALKAAERAEKTPSFANLHADGVARILTKDRDGAVSVLQRAAAMDPRSAAIQTDLATAYLARGRGNDYQLALAAATKSWSIEQTPAAAWNIAVALQYQHRDREAIAAWQNYLRHDGNSPWAVEASNRLRRLQER